IAENGRGLPVRPVEKNAPLLSVVETGLGIPVVISDKGVPFILDGYHPEPPPSVMTAGQDAEGTSTGFSDGTVIKESFGSLSAEPVDGFPVVALAASALSLVVALGGDATGVVDGMTLWIDGVEYEPTSDWSYNGSVTIYVVA